MGECKSKKPGWRLGVSLVTIPEEIERKVVKQTNAQLDILTSVPPIPFHWQIQTSILDLILQMEWFFVCLFVCFNDISRLFSAVFRAIAVCKFAAMLFVLTFVPAGIDEWNFPSHHSFFGLFLKEAAFKLCAHCGNPATVGWLFSVN